MPGTLCSERLSQRVQRTKTGSLDSFILRAVSLALSSSISFSVPVLRPQYPVALKLSTKNFGTENLFTKPKQPFRLEHTRGGSGPERHI